MMKTMKFSMLLLLAVVMMTAGCKKDDDGGSADSNYLEYKGERYSLSKGYLEDYGELGGGVFDVDITLVSSSINIVVIDEEVDELTGTGNLIYIDFRSSIAKAVATGNYSFSASEEDETFIFGIAGVDYNVTLEEGEELFVTGGTIKVVRSGNNYELDFDLQVNGTDALKGKFKGNLAYYDYSSGFRDKTPLFETLVK
jgi:hypothetical protein